MARTLMRKGANFTAAMVFQIASTNLVLEPSIIVALLIGWQFTVAEFAGGAVMIVVVALALRQVMNEGLVSEARKQSEQGLARFFRSGGRTTRSIMGSAVDDGGAVEDGRTVRRARPTFLVMKRSLSQAPASRRAFRRSPRR